MVKIINIVLGFTCQDICGSKNLANTYLYEKIAWYITQCCYFFFNKRSVKNCKSSEQYIPTAYKGVKRVSVSQVLLSRCSQCYKSRWFLAVLWSAAFRCVLHNVKTSRVILLLISLGFSLITHNWKTFKTSNWPQGQTMQLYLRLHRPQLVC